MYYIYIYVLDAQRALKISLSSAIWDMGAAHWPVRI